MDVDAAAGLSFVVMSGKELVFGFEVIVGGDAFAGWTAAVFCAFAGCCWALGLTARFFDGINGSGAYFAGCGFVSGVLFAERSKELMRVSIVFSRLKIIMHIVSAIGPVSQKMNSIFLFLNLNCLVFIAVLWVSALLGTHKGCLYVFSDASIANCLIFIMSSFPEPSVGISFILK